jgi:hypothetical protein
MARSPHSLTGGRHPPLSRQEFTVSANPQVTPADWPSAPAGNGHRPPHAREDDDDLIPFDDDDGPTEPLADDPPPPKPATSAKNRRGGWAVLAVGLAVVALAGAGAAALLGWRALDQASAARRLADQSRPADAVATPSAVPSAVWSDAPAPAASAEDATVAPDDPAGDPATGGSAAAQPPGDATVLVDPTGPPPPLRTRYAERVLPLRPGCATAVYLDLDAPRVVPATADPDVGASCTGTASVLRLGPGATAGALLPAAAAPTATATTCAQRLAAAPLAASATVPVRAGTALCLRTGTNGIVLLRVAPADRTGALAVRATSWTAADR